MYFWRINGLRLLTECRKRIEAADGFPGGCNRLHQSVYDGICRRQWAQCRLLCVRFQSSRLHVFIDFTVSSR